MRRTCGAWATTVAVVLSAVLVSGADRVRGETFRNLDFEEFVDLEVWGEPPDLHVSGVSACWAANWFWDIPPWDPRARVADLRVSTYSWLSGPDAVAIYWPPDAPVGWYRPGVLPIEGSCSLWLQLEYSYGCHDFAWASQVADVPADAKSLRFLTKACFGREIPSSWPDLSVTMDGQDIPMRCLGASEEDAVFLLAGDVSRYAGGTHELLLKAIYPPDPDPEDYPNWYASLNHNYMIDAIEFSPLPVPEPPTWVLAAVTAVGAWIVARVGRRACRR